MLKIFLMTKNEKKFIEDWVKYHGHYFGMENIHILDGSDDKDVIECYKKYSKYGLKVYFSSSGLNDLCEELNLLMHEHKGEDNFLIKLDTDEFLAFTKPFNLLSSNYLENFFRKGCLPNRKKTWSIRRLVSEKIIDYKYSQKNLYVDNINEYISKLPVTGQKYKASLTTWSVPSYESCPKPCRQLIRFSPLQYTHLKSFFHSSSFVSVDLGCHAGVTTKNSGVVDTGLTIIHYHSTSVEDAVERARKVLLSHDYFNEEDPLEVIKNKLKKIIALGEVQSFHKVEFYLNYINSIENDHFLSLEQLNKNHPHYRNNGEAREMKLVSNSLDYIDSLGIYNV